MIGAELLTSDDRTRNVAGSVDGWEIEEPWFVFGWLLACSLQRVFILFVARSRAAQSSAIAIGASQRVSSRINWRLEA